ALTIAHDQDYVDALTKTLVHKLSVHHFPAIGFVNEGKLDELKRDRQVANLQRWVDAGFALGNHSYSHESANDITGPAYVADIIRGEPVVRSLLAAKDKTLGWYRHPYLETGFPAATKRAVDEWLPAHHYRIAPVTIDADDWEFAEPYDDAIMRHDKPLQRRIMRAYLDYTAIRIDWSLRSAHVLFGREIAHVMLLHATRLNADAFDRLAALLRHAHLRPVSLESAMADPAYHTADRYEGKDGLNWLERWALTLRKDLPSNGDEDPPHWIDLLYDRVDNDRH
ncbi:MAG: polysaccharide deacetylase family protein, partial [Sphingomonas sp.]|uniref:polysaccharide deacetylase family protein n=1 Tax=Sphingomonas sp. TaxID=28214 RepID=UPI003F413612